MSRRTPVKREFEKDLVYLFQFPRSPAIPNVSPFCLKLETWLRISGIRYENVNCEPLTRSREGLMPFIELNGSEFCDSTLIIEHLSKVLNIDEKQGISDENWAHGRALEVLVENRLLVTMVYFRYKVSFDEFCNVNNADLHSFMPPPFPKPALAMLKWKLKRKYVNRLNELGMGRHAEEEVISFAEGDLKAVSNILGSKLFFLGDKPTRVDATVFAVLAQMIYLPMQTPHKRYLEDHCQNLIAFCNRMKLSYWPDWEETCRTRDLHTYASRYVKTGTV